MSQATPVLEKPRSSVAVPSGSAVLLAVAGVLALAHLPLLIAHGKSLWQREHYQLFPLVLVFAGILAYPAYKLAIESPATGRERRIGFLLLGLNWFMLAVAVVLDSPNLGALAFWILLIATAIGAGGWRTFRMALPALVYLLLIIPPPLNLDGRLITFLQTYTSKIASHVLDLMGVFHALNGVVVEVGDKKYEVERACSGISSLLSVLACSLFYVFWVKAHWVRGIMLILASVFWVLINNVVRVVAIVYCDTQWGIDLSKDEAPFFLHTMLGIVLFALTLALIASTDRLFLFLGSTVKWGSSDKARFESQSRPSGAPPFTMTWGGFAAVAVAYGLLIAFQIGDYGFGSGNVPESRMIAGFNSFNAATMPDEIGGWRKMTSPSAFTAADREDLLDVHGAHSRSWRYQRGNLWGLVSFDYPFPYWHDLRICYTMTGWSIEEGATFRHPLTDGAGEVECFTARMSRPVERNAYLWFGEFDLNGRPVVATDPGQFSYRFVHRFDALKDRWGRLTGKTVEPEARAFQVLQVQVLTESYGPLSDAERKEFQDFFTGAMEGVRKKALEVRSAAAKQ